MRSTMTALLLCISLMVFSISCSKKAERAIKYKELTIKKLSVDYVSRDIPFAGVVKRDRHNIFLRARNVWHIDLKEKTEKVIFKDGVGPDEILKPLKIRLWKNDCYINSSYPLNYIYKFNPTSQKEKLERFNIDKFCYFDDFEFISENLIAMANVYWKDGLLRIYDTDKGTVKEIGKPHLVQMMMKFNVNAASLCIYDGMIYLVESITPEIRVVSVADLKSVNLIRLSPPFYVPLPKKYNVQKYDLKNHRKWMASWTSISNIMVNNGWLLISYKWGYNWGYAYELINLQNTWERYYIKRCSNHIYGFEIEGNRITFDLVEETDQGDLKWQKAETFI